MNPRTLILHALGVAALLAATHSPASTEVKPRLVVDDIAAAIESHYFDADAAARIAGKLSSAALDGQFDATTDPHALAIRLTELLVQEDRHFKVSPPRGQPEKAAEPATGLRRYSFAERLKRQGQGFRKTEVLPGNIAYVEVSNFADIDFDHASDPARRAADAVLTLVAMTDAIIVDLRANGGGAPAMVGYLASAFVERDAEVYNDFVTRAESFSEAPAETAAEHLPDTPLYVLVSSATGSAAEAFAYTLQAADRATVVGQVTAGAANPGTEIETPSGFSIFVSSGSPVNPITGRNWEAIGVQPDVVTEAGQALVVARTLALQSMMAGEIVYGDARWALEAMESEFEPGSGQLQSLAGTYGDWLVSVEQGALTLERPGRKVEILDPLQEDLFHRRDDPTVRYRFLSNRLHNDVIERTTAFGSVTQRVRAKDK
jgi:hypothetical protein